MGVKVAANLVVQQYVETGWCGVQQWCIVLKSFYTILLDEVTKNLYASK